MPHLKKLTIPLHFGVMSHADFWFPGPDILHFDGKPGQWQALSIFGADGTHIHKILIFTSISWFALALVSTLR